MSFETAVRHGASGSAMRRNQLKSVLALREARSACLAQWGELESSLKYSACEECLVAPRIPCRMMCAEIANLLLERALHTREGMLRGSNVPMTVPVDSGSHKRVPQQRGFSGCTGRCNRFFRVFVKAVKLPDADRCNLQSVLTCVKPTGSGSQWLHHCTQVNWEPLWLHHTSHVVCARNLCTMVPLAHTAAIAAPTLLSAAAQQRVSASKNDAMPLSGVVAIRFEGCNLRAVIWPIMPAIQLRLSAHSSTNQKFWRYAFQLLCVCSTFAAAVQCYSFQAQTSQPVSYRWLRMIVQETWSDTSMTIIGPQTRAREICWALLVWFCRVWSHLSLQESLPRELPESGANTWIRDLDVRPATTRHDGSC
jgi:hypothetical protein